MATIRGRAAMGLVFCQGQRSLEAVERLYDEETQRCAQIGQPNSDLFLELASAMGHKAYSADHGLQKRFELYGQADYHQVMAPYLKEYMTLRAAPSKTAQNNR